MRNLKKALSLTLALALSLALAVPAFAVEDNWDLTVAGKPDAETFVGERTFTLHNWIFADDEETETRTVTKAANTENFKAENLCVAGKGDTLVITNGGEWFEGVDLMAWSDPDGDGVYDNRVMREYWNSYEEDGWPFSECIDELLPADTAGPLSGCTPGGDGDLYYNLYFVQAIQEYNEATGDQSVVPGKVSIGTGEGGFGEVTELRISVDQLLEEFGPNTLVQIGSGNGGAWFVVLGGNAAQPSQPAEVKTADPTNDKLTVNGAAKDPTVYKIGGSNYFKIRDVAAVLNGTEKQFAVGYAGGKVTVTSGQPYEMTGTELKGAPAASGSASPSNDAIVIDGVETSLTVYKIGGSNYFKLRDLGEALNFYVGWEAGRGVFIETDKPYSK